MSLKSLVKGWAGEARNTIVKKIFLDSRTYIDLNNITIQTHNGTTQIDHVIVSRYGIFVVETKNMSGWIFGDAKSPRWTQSIFGKKYAFQNPINQNYRHTKALSEFLGIDHGKFFSVITFRGGCEFKTSLPSNVMTKGYISYIKSYTTELFSDQEVRDIASAIKEGMLPKSWSTHKQHISSLNDRFSNTNTCPNCGSALVLRTKKSGANAGSQFYGCVKFPGCGYVCQVAGHS